MTALESSSLTREARAASPADNRALLDLAAACPMKGDIGLCITRSPDFFALNRLEGEHWTVGVVDGTGGADGEPVGCVAIAERTSYLHGVASRLMYVSDLKVHPAHRGGPPADALTEYASRTCRAVGGAAVPTLVTVLAGNHSMERRAVGPRGLPHLKRFATIRVHAVPLLWARGRRSRSSEYNVSRGTWADIDEMAALWRHVMPSRQCGPVHDEESLSSWIRDAPGLAIDDYLIARTRDGRIAGFVGLWDQHSFKQLRVTNYSPRMGAVRAAFNLIGPALGATPLPRPGQSLRSLAAVHLCVPSTGAAVLRSLLLDAHDQHRGRGFSFFTLGLDVRDPLALALNGLFAQPTDVHAYITTPAGRYLGARLDDRPLHFESALV